jgi:hypothetical protein
MSNLNFTNNPSPSSTFKIVGFESAVPGGEKTITVAALKTGLMSLGVVAGLPLTYHIDGGGSVVTVSGSEFIVPNELARTITGWILTAKESGSLIINVSKRTPPSTTFVSIVASAPPTLSSQIDASSSTLTGWTTSLAAGDVVRFIAQGTPVSITQATLLLLTA